MISIDTAAAAASSTPVSHWVSADGLSCMPMLGCPASEALAELLGQCGEDGQREAILAGAFTVLQAYKVTATFVNSSSNPVDANQAEVLGDAWGATYATREQAQDAADAVMESTHEYYTGMAVHAVVVPA